VLTLPKQNGGRPGGQRWRRVILVLALVQLVWPPLPATADTRPDASVSVDEMRRQRRMADDLYRATSADAATFERAIGAPQVRDELQRTLKKDLSDDTLRAMALQAHAEAAYWLKYRHGIESVIGVERPEERGRLVPGLRPLDERIEPIVNPGGLPAPQPFEAGGNLPVQDRWRILDALGRPENWLDPYNTNTYKGDKPIFGEDWFLNVNAIFDAIYEPSRVPLGIGAQFTARPGENNNFGRYGRYLFNQNAIVSLELFKGDTAFKPQEIEIRVTPVFNFNRLDVGELNVVNIDPRRGTSRNDNFLALQEGFIEYHLRDVSEFYDFDSLRVGIQPFNADFRGFLFQDDQLGFRLFGDREANLWQYNLAYFRRLEKDTNSNLNDLGKKVRRDGIFIANLFHQDLPVPGFQSQLIYVRNDNLEGNEKYYDNNGFLVRPNQIGDDRGYDYHVNYFGYNGDGHFGRFNLTTSAYWANGHLSHNQLSPDPQNSGAHINAFFFAAEPSIDFDWTRLRFSALYQSGSAHPTGGHATGFDSIMENPQFAGSDSSYWIRQSLPFIGGGGFTALNTQNGVLADLRSAKGEGQSNFINPGVMLAGVGNDFDILPELRLSTNFNYLRFAETAPIEVLRHQSSIPNSIGYDLSAALTYRPLFTQNIIFRLSGAVLLPGDGLKQIYNTAGGTKLFGSGNFLYAVLANVILTY
jgi:hypothetical protein